LKAHDVAIDYEALHVMAEAYVRATSASARAAKLNAAERGRHTAAHYYDDDLGGTGGQGGAGVSRQREQRLAAWGGEGGSSARPGPPEALQRRGGTFGAAGRPVRAPTVATIREF
jgi:hypothetical protein